MAHGTTIRDSQSDRAVARVDLAFLAVGSLAVVDGAVGTAVLGLPMVALGALALGAHFLGKTGQRSSRRRLRLVAFGAGFALAGATVITASDPGAHVAAQGMLLAGWLYWLALFVAITERAADARFRRRMVFALGYSASLVVGARLFEALVAQNIGGADLYLMTRNGYGAVLAILAPLIIVTWSSRSRALGVVWAAATVLALVANSSRGSWVAAVAWVVVFGIGLIAAQQKVSGGYRFAMVLVGLVIVGASFQFVANSTYLAPVQERAATLQNTEEDISAVTRFALQEKALVIINAEPAVGIGLGNFRLTSLGNEAAERLPSRYWPVFARLTAHNSYLELLSEGGILGGAIIVGIVLVAIVTAIRAAVLFGRIDPSVSIVGLGVAASTVSLGTYLWLKGGLATTLAWVILGVWFGTEPALGISRLGNERRDEAPSP